MRRLLPISARIGITLMAAIWPLGVFTYLPVLNLHATTLLALIGFLLVIIDAISRRRLLIPFELSVPWFAALAITLSLWTTTHDNQSKDILLALMMFALPLQFRPDARSLRVCLALSVLAGAAAAGMTAAGWLLNWMPTAYDLRTGATLHFASTVSGGIAALFVLLVITFGLALLPRARLTSRFLLGLGAVLIGAIATTSLATHAAAFIHPSGPRFPLEPMIVVLALVLAYLAARTLAKVKVDAEERPAPLHAVVLTMLATLALAVAVAGTGPLTGYGFLAGLAAGFAMRSRDVYAQSSYPTPLVAPAINYAEKDSPKSPSPSLRASSSFMPNTGIEEQPRPSLRGSLRRPRQSRRAENLRPCPTTPSAILFLPAAAAAIALLAINALLVFPANRSDGRNYDVAAAEDLATGAYTQLHQRLDFVERHAPRERRTHWWRARVLLAQGRPMRAVTEFIASLDNAPGQLLPPPDAGERETFMLQLRDFESASAEPKSQYGYARALVALGETDEALAIVRLHARPPDPAGASLEPGPLADGIAFLLGDDALKESLRAWPSAELLAVLRNWGAEIIPAPEWFGEASLPVVLAGVFDLDTTKALVSLPGDRDVQEKPFAIEAQTSPNESSYWIPIFGDARKWVVEWIAPVQGRGPARITGRNTTWDLLTYQTTATTIPERPAVTVWVPEAITQK